MAAENGISAPSDLVVDFRPHRRIIEGILDAGVDFAREVKPKANLTTLVLGDSLDKLLVRLWMEGEAHTAKRCRILAKTSSPGIGFT